MDALPSMIFEEILPFVSTQSLQLLSESLTTHKKKSAKDRLRVRRTGVFHYSLRGADRVVSKLQMSCDIEMRALPFSKLYYDNWDRRAYKTTHVKAFTVSGSPFDVDDQDRKTVPVQEMLAIAKLPVDRSASVLIGKLYSVLHITAVSKPEESSVVTALARTISANFDCVHLTKLEGCVDGVNEILRRTARASECRSLMVSRCSVNWETFELIKRIAKQDQLQKLLFYVSGADCDLEFLTEIADFSYHTRVTKSLQFYAQDHIVLEQIDELVNERMSSGSSVCQISIITDPISLGVLFHVKPLKRKATYVLPHCSKTPR